MYETRADHFRARAHDLLEEMKKQVMNETGQEFSRAILNRRECFMMHGTRYIYTTFTYVDEFMDVLYQYDLSMHRLKEQNQYKINANATHDPFLDPPKITQSSFV
jgi:hypothetical protein